jgi:hypothetical protein
MLALEFDVYRRACLVGLVAIDHCVCGRVHAAALLKNGRIIEKTVRHRRKFGIGLVAGLLAGAAAYAPRGINQNREVF